MINNLKIIFGLLVLTRYVTIGFRFNGPCPQPANFPPDLSLSVKPYHSFGNEVNIPQAYYGVPRDSMDVVKVVNWAHRNGFRVRASGSQHSWSPVYFAPQEDGISCPKTILLDTTKHLNSVQLNPHDIGRPELNSVTVGPGILLMKLLEFLEENGLGLYSTPFIPSPTVGGMLAIGAHGTGVGSAVLDRMSPGHSSGSFSNLVIEMTIVAWDNETSSYALKTIHRSENETKAFLTNFGRTFITSVTIRVGKNQNLRSQTHFYVPSAELFAHPDAATDSMRTASKFIETYGRVNFFALPPSNFFWVHTMHNEPVKPPTSKLVRQPVYSKHINAIQITKPMNLLLRSSYSVVNRIPALRRLYQLFPLVMNAIIAGQEFITNTVDAWGPSKNHFMQSSGKASHVTDNPFMLITSRKNLQLVVHIMRKHFEELWKEYKSRNEIPTPGITFFRVTGLDNPELIGIPGAESPSFSALRPIPEYPDFDLGIWMDTTGFVEYSETNEFAVRLQSLLYRDLHGRYAIIRAEWSKGWAYTNDGAWRNSTILNHYARTLSSSDELEEWNWAVRTLNKNDPHKIFSNSFLDDFLSEKQ